MEKKAREDGVFEWGDKGTLEILPCATVQLSMETVGTGAANLTTWDFKEAVKTVTKGASDPLFIDLDIGRERSVAKLGFEDPSVVDLVISTLDKRVVPIGKARLRVEASRYEVDEGQWRAHFFKSDADASTAVKEEVFRRALPAKRPDTLVLRSLPCKWFGLGVTEEGEAEGEEEEEGASLVRLMTLMQSLGWWVVAVDVEWIRERGPSGLFFDAYVQLRKLSEVEAALAFFKGKALRYVPSGKVLPVEYKVDMSGFMDEQAVAARKETRKREGEARRAYKERLQELTKDREVLQAAVDELSEESRKGPSVDEADAVKRVLIILDELLGKAKRSETQAAVAGEEFVVSGDSKQLKALSSVLGQLRSHLTTAKKVVKDTKAAAREAYEREAQERRKDTVREARVARAKELKAVEDSWRAALVSDRLKAAGATPYGAGLIKAAQSALGTARDLVLSKFEGPLSEEDMEGHVGKLKKVVKDAQVAVTKGAAGLELQATATELEARLQKAMEEDLDDYEEEEEEEDEEQEESTMQGQEGSWRWPFSCLLKDDEAFMQSEKRAKQALASLDDARASGGDPEEAKAQEAIKELRFHVENLLGPKRRRHRAVVPRAKQLDRLVVRWRVVAEESEGVRRAIEAAETAVKRAYKGMGREGEGAASSRGDDELIQVMEAAIERVAMAAQNVAQRKKDEEEARRRIEEEKRRKEEAKQREAQAREEEERAREEREEKARLEELERRKAFLEKFETIRQARRNLRLYRRHVMAQPPPTQRLLQAGGLSIVAKRQQQAKEEAEAAAAAAKEAAERIIVTPVPILNRWRPWASRETIVETSVANAVSNYYWGNIHNQDEEEEEPPLQYPPELRLKPVVIKISEAPPTAVKRPREEEADDTATRGQIRPKLRGAAVVVTKGEDDVSTSTTRERRRGAVVMVEK